MHKQSFGKTTCAGNLAHTFSIQHFSTALAILQFSSENDFHGFSAALRDAPSKHNLHGSEEI